MLAKGKIMNACDEFLRRENVEATSIGTASTQRFGSARVWLVDDNARFRSLLASMLEEEGFECERQFPNPDEALAALVLESPPDIILLDIEMGEYNGLDAIRPLKSAARETHVLMLTTFATPRTRERAFREGASDFMLKLWLPSEIAEHMRQAMEFGTVAGLMNTFLSGGISVAEKAAPPKAAMAPPRLSIAERWMAYLRGVMKFSPS
jgi:DNA-binding NarL/FixJ family response regulator